MECGVICNLLDARNSLFQQHLRRPVRADRAVATPGLEYHKPNIIPRKLDEEKQKAFIESYEKLLNSLGDDEAVLIADAVHPTHAARSGQCAVSSRQARAGMARPASAPYQTALHPNLLPALEPDRAVMGPYAQKRHAQQVLRNLRPIRRCDARVPA